MTYDGIIIGGGHAGIEAALAMARMNKKTVLITGNLEKVASLPCNPSIGGPAKGVVVREIDALGGQMALSADLAQIQIKKLNASKGPAVHALRAQIDKIKYPKVMLEVLKNTKNLELIEGLVESLLVEEQTVLGVVLQNKEVILAKTVIITTGTYLASSLLVGHEKTVGGPSGEPTTFGLSKQLKELGFELVRLKTGTPPRIAKDSVDLSKLIVQPGDEGNLKFSYQGPFNESAPRENCYLLHTTLDTHQIIQLNLDKSAMYSGLVEGVGPRYCPSIEDKVVRFNTKERHQLFLEPESLSLDEYYLQGLSTSMPRDVQEALLKTIPGLEDARIVRYAYAIEYDAINPLQLKPSLETKKIKNLFSAGQMNGTSGYEEAAGQGIMAGINAALKIEGKDPLILKRDQAYIGVLIDDLVTKGTKEPYRLLTSRAEHRLFLRDDNADLRLTEIGFKIGAVSEKQYQGFKEKQAQIEKLKQLVEQKRINPNEETKAYLINTNKSFTLHEGISLSEMLKKSDVTKEDIKHFITETFDEEVYDQVEIQIKYDGYIAKARKEADRMTNLDDYPIPERIDYHKIPNISSEAKEKLTKVNPRTIGQASRILGVNPPDISLLAIYLKSGGAKYDV